MDSKTKAPKNSKSSFKMIFSAALNPKRKYSRLHIKENFIDYFKPNNLVNIDKQFISFYS